MKSKLGKKILSLLVTSCLIVSIFGIVANADDVGIRDRERIQDRLYLQECILDDVRVLLVDLTIEIDEFKTDEDIDGFGEILVRIEELLNEYQIKENDTLCVKECLCSDVILLLQELQTELEEFIDSEDIDKEGIIETIEELIVTLNEQLCECKCDCECKYENDCTKEQYRNTIRIRTQNREQSKEQSEKQTGNKIGKK